MKLYGSKFHGYFNIMQANTSRFDWESYNTLAKMEDVVCNEEARQSDYNDIIWF